ncbi:protein kinase family protein [Candidatus Woesearchaeota archaeon]|nr:protein kinase family protein [Candidatus Woesearchaeota archaeon]
MRKENCKAIAIFLTLLIIGMPFSFAQVCPTPNEQGMIGKDSVAPIIESIRSDLLAAGATGRADAEIQSIFQGLIRDKLSEAGYEISDDVLLRYFGSVDTLTLATDYYNLNYNIKQGHKEKADGLVESMVMIEPARPSAVLSPKVDITSAGTALSLDIQRPSPFTMDGEEWTPKAEFHTTLIGFGHDLQKILKTIGLSNKEAKDKAKEIMTQAAQGIDFSVTRTGRYSIVRDDQGRRTIIEHVQAEGMQEFYDNIDQRLQALGIQEPIARSPAHITLYTAPDGKAIGLTTQDQVDGWGREATPGQAQAIQSALQVPFPEAGFATPGMMMASLFAGMGLVFSPAMTDSLAVFTAPLMPFIGISAVAGAIAYGAAEAYKWIQEENDDKSGYQPRADTGTSEMQDRIRVLFNPYQEMFSGEIIDIVVRNVVNNLDKSQNIAKGLSYDMFEGLLSQEEFDRLSQIVNSMDTIAQRVGSLRSTSQIDPTLIFKRVIGIGGFGIVQVVEKDGQEFVLKIAMPGTSLRTEYDTLDKLKDSGAFVIPYEYYGDAYLREYVEGDVISDTTIHADALRDISNAYYFAKQSGIGLYDFKAQNIVVDSQGNVKIIDFQVGEYDFRLHLSDLMQYVDGYDSMTDAEESALMDELLEISEKGYSVEAALDKARLDLQNGMSPATVIRDLNALTGLTQEQEAIRDGLIAKAQAKQTQTVQEAEPSAQSPAQEDQAPAQAPASTGFLRRLGSAARNGAITAGVFLASSMSAWADSLGSVQNAQTGLLSSPILWYGLGIAAAVGTTYYAMKAVNWLSNRSRQGIKPVSTTSDGFHVLQVTEHATGRPRQMTVDPRITEFFNFARRRLDIDVAITGGDVRRPMLGMPGFTGLSDLDIVTPKGITENQEAALRSEAARLFPDAVTIDFLSQGIGEEIFDEWGFTVSRFQLSSDGILYGSAQAISDSENGVLRLVPGKDVKRDPELRQLLRGIRFMGEHSLEPDPETEQRLKNIAAGFVADHISVSNLIFSSVMNKEFESIFSNIRDRQGADRTKSALMRFGLLQPLLDAGFDIDRMMDRILDRKLNNEKILASDFDVLYTGTGALKGTPLTLQGLRDMIEQEIASLDDPRLSESIDDLMARYQRYETFHIRDKSNIVDGIKQTLALMSQTPDTLENLRGRKIGDFALFGPAESVEEMETVLGVSRTQFSQLSIEQKQRLIADTQQRLFDDVYKEKGDDIEILSTKDPSTFLPNRGMTLGEWNGLAVYDRYRISMGIPIATKGTDQGSAVNQEAQATLVIDGFSANVNEEGVVVYTKDGVEVDRNDLPLEIKQQLDDQFNTELGSGSPLVMKAIRVDGWDEEIEVGGVILHPEQYAPLERKVLRESERIFGLWGEQGLGDELKVLREYGDLRQHIVEVSLLSGIFADQVSRWVASQEGMALDVHPGSVQSAARFHDLGKVSERGRAIIFRFSGRSLGGMLVNDAIRLNAIKRHIGFTYEDELEGMDSDQVRERITRIMSGLKSTRFAEQIDRELRTADSRTALGGIYLKVRIAQVEEDAATDPNLRTIFNEYSVGETIEGRIRLELDSDEKEALSWAQDWAAAHDTKIEALQMRDLYDSHLKDQDIQDRIDDGFPEDIASIIMGHHFTSGYPSRFIDPKYRSDDAILLMVIDSYNAYRSRSPMYGYSVEEPDSHEETIEQMKEYYQDPMRLRSDQNKAGITVDEQNRILMMIDLLDNFVANHGRIIGTIEGALGT